jgi:DNA helicase-2/ATP-dependent DNA helicase PcrA
LATYLGLELDNLPNEEQREAIETIDGPVLVVAGPGTGKTQLLSLRAANILQQRDVSPRNILCLTFTSAGAEAMTKRLTRLIGRDALGVQVATFHSFATELAQRFPEYFGRGNLDAALTNLQAKMLLCDLLKNLPERDPLYQRPLAGVPGNLDDVHTLISTIKKSGLTPDELRAIAEQNLAFFDYIEQQGELIELMSDALQGGKDKYRKLDELSGAIARIVDGAPVELTTPLIETPGIYISYARYLTSVFARAELYDADGKTTNFSELRDKLFTAGGKTGPRVFKDRVRCERLLSALCIYQAYREHLAENGLYDFDDMILDAIAALEQHDELRATLQEQYQYVLVDEFQDTNGAQMRLLDLLVGQGEVEAPNILVVGDDDQAIYRFQGASVEYLNAFEKHYQNTKRIVLKTNYRSTPTLVKLGQKLATQIENRSSASVHEKQLTAHSDEGEQLSFTARAYPNPELQYFDVARAIRERIDAGFMAASTHPGEEIAVIARNHRGLRGLIPYLKHFDVPYSYEISASVAQIESLQTLLMLMRFCAAHGAGLFEHAETCVPALLAAPEFGLKPETYFAFAVEVREKHLGWLEALKAHSNKQLNDFYAWLCEVSQHSINSSARTALFELIKPLRSYYEQQTDENLFSVIEFNYGVRALLDFVEGEQEASRTLTNAPLRLAEVVELFDETQRFRADINVKVPVGRPDAITLTTAHSSKGLEYDLVYLIDADDKTWHTRSLESKFLSQNMLFAESGDLDDDRRLLFVAATRARSYLELSYSAAEPVRELIGEVELDECEPDAFVVAEQSQHHWEDDYYPQNEGLIALAEPLRARQKMSASFLNSFVNWKNAEADEGSGGAFFRDRILGLPSPPSSALEFGILVHDFLEKYLAEVVRAQSTTVEELVARYRAEIDWLDFEESDKAHMHERFEGVVTEFLPKMLAFMGFGEGSVSPASAEGSGLEGSGLKGSGLKGSGLEGSRDAAFAIKTELWVKALVENIPLVGKCDVLICDEATRTIKIFDYKTGNPDNADFGAGYHRQLQFYKLLIENSSDFKGWTVLGGADLFVEPSKKQGNTVVEPQFFTVDEAELEHLSLLMQAVWYRVQNNLFDVSDFTTSEQWEHMRANCVYRSNSGGHKAGDAKEPTAADIQPVFEQWLIETWQQRTSKN